MFEIKPTSSLLEYNDEFFEVVYSNDQPDFIYTSKASPVFIMLPHQLFLQVIQEYPAEDLFEAEDGIELLSFEHL